MAMAPRRRYLHRRSSRRESDQFPLHFARHGPSSTPTVSSSAPPSRLGTTPSRPKQQTRVINPHNSTVTANADAPGASTKGQSGVDGGEESDPDHDALHDVIMAVDMVRQGSVGCAYYVAREEKLFFMEDVKLGYVETIAALKLHVNPTVILVSTRIDDDVLDRLDPELRQRAASTSESNDQFRMPYILEVRPSAEFNYDSGKSKLVNLRLDADDGPNIKFTVPNDIPGSDGFESHNDFIGRQEYLLRLAGWINLESTTTVGCAGALISYLQRRRASAYLPGDDDAHSLFRIANVEMFSLRGFMFVNADTLLSLQIIQLESHPNSHNQGPNSNGAKEGLSVYGLFQHFARTSQGKELLHQYFLRPSLSMAVINQRLDAVGVFVRPDNSNMVQDLIAELTSIKDMRRTMLCLQKGVSSSQGNVSHPVWLSLMKFAGAALTIRDTLENVNAAEGLQLRNQVLVEFNARDLAMIGTEIRATIDFEQSDLEHRTIISPNVDDILDGMRREWDALEDMLGHIARQLQIGRAHV